MKTSMIAATALLALSACASTPPLSASMNDTDHDRLEAAHFYAFAGTLSRSAVWSNVATGMGGTVRSSEEFQDPDIGLRCRKFLEETRSTDSAREDRTGTACQQPDGNLVVTFDQAAEE
jgi:surface antigen